jgi:AraC-like DNA-binding protein
MSIIVEHHFIEQTACTESELSWHIANDRLTIEFLFLGTDCGFSYQRKAGLDQISFVYSLAYLQSIDFDLRLVDTEKGKAANNICCNTQMILHQVVTNKHEGAFKQVFLQSKAMEMLLYVFATRIHFSGCSSCQFLNQPLEQNKIEKAKDFILQNLAQPPTIPVLALQVNLNQCYLKKGFKEMYGLTIFEFVQEQRMKKAQMLLGTKAYSISQVADMVGYSNVSNFSNAFRRQLGVTPSELVKN